MRTARILAAASLFLSVSTFAGGKERQPLDFRGLSLGSSPPTWLHVSHYKPAPRGYYGDREEIHVFGDTTPYLGVSVIKEDYLFLRGRLVGGRLFFPAGTWQHVQAALTSMYGKPDLTSRSDGSVWHWTDTGTFLTLSRAGATSRVLLQLEREDLSPQTRLRAQYGN